MDLSNLPNASTTRLMWREQLAALPRSAYFALRRLLCREHRCYLTINDRVAARFTSVQDAQAYLDWLGKAHTATFAFGRGVGQEDVAQHIEASAIADGSRTS